MARVRPLHPTRQHVKSSGTCRHGSFRCWWGQGVGLVNGAQEKVVEIVYAEGEQAPAPPPYAVVRLHNCTRPQ